MMVNGTVVFAILQLLKFKKMVSSGVKIATSVYIPLAHIREVKTKKMMRVLKTKTNNRIKIIRSKKKFHLSLRCQRIMTSK
jgi:murein L,D-transpeptidase YafK